MTLKGGTSQACASCKYQRRKCTPECPLAPYFPPDQPKMFQNAHKLFGVSKILKLLENLDPLQKEAAMRSIICQANIRDRFPVHGCWGMICQLHYQIRQTEEELHAVLQHLEMYRQQHHQILPSSVEDVPSQLELGMAPPQPYMQHCSHTLSNNIGYTNSSYIDTNDATANLWAQHQQHPYPIHNDINGMTIQSPLVATQQETILQDVQDYDEMHPLFDTIDDRQSYIDTKDPYETSSEESPKNAPQSFQHNEKNELKTAAAGLSLTSVN